MNQFNKNHSNKLPLYSLQDVQKHNTIHDAWTTIHNNVYHIPSKWILEDHPGGSIIQNAIGRDATDMFEQIGHSHNAHIQLEKFLIGYLRNKSKNKRKNNTY
jgi:cytochrome b involved in lipid metabolism